MMDICKMSTSRIMSTQVVIYSSLTSALLIRICSISTEPPVIGVCYSASGDGIFYRCANRHFGGVAK